MRENINKVTERGERLDSLQDKTGELGFHASRTRVLWTWLPHPSTGDDDILISLLHRQPRRLRARIPKRCKPRSQADVVCLVFLHRIVSRLTLLQQVEGYANEDHYRCRYLRLDRHHRRSHRQGVSLSVVYRYEWLLTGMPTVSRTRRPLGVKNHPTAQSRSRLDGAVTLV